MPWLGWCSLTRGCHFLQACFRLWPSPRQIRPPWSLALGFLPSPSLTGRWFGKRVVSLLLRNVIQDSDPLPQGPAPGIRSYVATFCLSLADLADTGLWFSHCPFVSSFLLRALHTWTPCPRLGRVRLTCVTWFVYPSCLFLPFPNMGGGGRGVFVCLYKDFDPFSTYIYYMFQIQDVALQVFTLWLHCLRVLYRYAYASSPYHVYQGGYFCMLVQNTSLYTCV